MKSALSLREALRQRSTSAREVLTQSLDVIAQREPVVKAWTLIDVAAATARADALDAEPSRLDEGLLAGVPVAVKDLMDTADLPTGYGSPIYSGHRPAQDAACVAALRKAGANILGKTVTTEFAYFKPGPTTNPWNAAHTPGGSSSGSAAAVAAGMVPLALGSQTAGSLIRPASYCGVFALKPTHGLFDLQGVKGLSPSLDTLGWLARTADDLELMRCALSGEPFEPLGRLSASGRRIGVCHTHEWPLAQPDGQAAFLRAVGLVEVGGVATVPRPLPDAQVTLLDDQKLIMAHEAAIALAPELRQHADRLSDAMLGLLRTGSAITPDEHAAALARTREAKSVVRQLMADVDALLVPAAPGEAPAGLAATGDPVFSRVWTLLGLPCVNVPGLRGPNGLPIGVQLVGHPRRERELLALAALVHSLLQ